MVFFDILRFYPVNSVQARLRQVVARLVPHHQKDQYRASHTQGEAGYINERVAFTIEKAPESDG